MVSNLPTFYTTDTELASRGIVSVYMELSGSFKAEEVKHWMSHFL